MAARRRWLLGAALVASIAAALLVQGPESELAPKRGPRAAVESSDQGARTASAVGKEQPVAPTALSFVREEYATETEDLFPPRSWRPPPPPPAKPPPPSAPPLPFQYMGKLEEGGQTLVFLSQQQRTLAVRQGETVDGVYRVDRISPESIVFVYLPLKQKQSLQLGRLN